MDQSIEQALRSLLPTINGALPVKLVELAASLLAQSRTGASNLKAEEEIARSYACANLACERLKQRLNLPKIDPRPPCPPRVYQKLYKFLEQALPPRRRGRPPKNSLIPRPNVSQAPTAQQKAPLRVSPRVTPKRKASPTITPRPNLSPPKIKPSKDTADADIVPSWVKPLLRHLCQHVFRPLVAPDALIGVRTVLSNPDPCLPNNDSASIEDRRDKLPALVIGICVYVNTRLSGCPLSVPQLEAERKASLKVLELPEFANSEMEKIGPKDVDDWIWDLAERGWVRHEWYQNIKCGSDSDVVSRVHGVVGQDGLEGSDDDDDSEQSEFERSLSPQSAVLHRAREAMIQVDYLSDQKRLEYLEWKDRIMKMVEEKERSSSAE